MAIDCSNRGSSGLYCYSKEWKSIDSRLTVPSYYSYSIESKWIDHSLSNTHLSTIDTLNSYVDWRLVFHSSIVSWSSHTCN